MAGQNYLGPDSEFNWLQFLSNHEMQTLLSDNLFVNGFTEDNAFSSGAVLRLPVPPNLLQQTTHIGGNEIFAAVEDANVSLAADLQQCFAAGQNGPQQQDHQHCFAMTTNRSNTNLTGFEPATCVLSAFASDPAFLERAAKYSPFAKEICQNVEESAPETFTSGDSTERAVEDAKYSRSKRKAANSEATKAKRWKGSKRRAEQGSNDNFAETTDEKKNVKAPPTALEKPNYVHVRARRGEATDSHSLAERVRREKISERMKLLQDLVPGCCKTKSKVSMLDNIINHIRSLQRQVEVLSLKLATLSPRFDSDINSFSAVVVDDDVLRAKPSNNWWNFS